MTRKVLFVPFFVEISLFVHNKRPHYSYNFDKTTTKIISDDSLVTYFPCNNKHNYITIITLEKFICVYCAMVIY